MKKFLIFLMLLTAVWSLPAQNETIFEEANLAYNQGDYPTAIGKYEQILENGKTSSELYYNLANAHYKVNNVAPSIYFYEKALQLDPNDTDIRNNLALARNRVIDDVQGEQETGISRIWNALVTSLGYNEWAWVAITFAFLFTTFFLLYYLSSKSGLKRTFFSLSMISLLVGFITLTFAFQQQSHYGNNNYAIIYSQNAPVYAEPTLRSNEVFVLHEGTKIEVMETYQNWIKFELPNGLQGWMEQTDVKLF